MRIKGYKIVKRNKYYSYRYMTNTGDIKIGGSTGTEYVVNGPGFKDKVFSDKSYIKKAINIYNRKKTHDFKEIRADIKLTEQLIRELEKDIINQLKFIQGE